MEDKDKLDVKCFCCGRLQKEDEVFTNTEDGYVCYDCEDTIDNELYDYNPNDDENDY